MTRRTKHSEALEIAIMEYKSKLKANGTSEMAVSMAITSGLDFLLYYEKARAEVRSKRKQE